MSIQCLSVVINVDLHQAREADIDLDILFSEALQHSSLTVSADESKLKLVVKNLVSNALKFTKNSQVRRVVVEVDMVPSRGVDSDESLVVRVVDTGPGISKVVVAAALSDA